MRETFICPLCCNNVTSDFRCTKCRMDFSEAQFIFYDENFQRSVQQYAMFMRRVRLFWKIAGCFIIGCIVLIAASNALGLETLMFNAIGGLAIGGVAMLLVMLTQGSKVLANQKRKHHVIIEAVLRRYFHPLHYVPHGGPMIRLLPELNLVRRWNREFSSHEITSQYRGVRFMFSDLSLRNERGERSVQVIQGPWLTLEMGKAVSQPVLVTSSASQLQWNFHRNTEISTEDINFNNRFKVFAASGIYAFKILTPSMIELLINSGFAHWFPFNMVFTGNRVHVLIETGRQVFDFYNLVGVSGTGTSWAQTMKAHRQSKFSVKPIEDQILFIQNLIDLLLQNEYFFDQASVST